MAYEHRRLWENLAGAVAVGERGYGGALDEPKHWGQVHIDRDIYMYTYTYIYNVLT